MSTAITINLDRKNVAILGLSISAFILLVLLVLLELNSAPTALAAGQDRGGDYAMTTALTATGEQALWILDARSRTIGIYQFDPAARRLELRRTFPIAQFEIPPGR